MRVTAKDTVAVSPTSTFSNNSELWTVANRGANATGINSSGGITIAPGDFNPERIQIDDGFLRRNGLPYSLPLVNVGDFLGDVTGVSSYSFGNYEILVTEPPLSTSGGRQKEITPIVPTPNRLTIASYNVENLNPFSGERFDVLSQQIISNLRTPDIIGLQEIQDNNGPINDGTVAADLTYKALINSIKTLGVELNSQKVC